MNKSSLAHEPCAPPTCPHSPQTELLARALRQALQVALTLAQHLEWAETTDALFAVFVEVDRRCRASEWQAWDSRLIADNQPPGGRA